MEEDNMIIGICGKSGCGKSTLSNQIIKLTNNKAIHLDIDKVGHKVLLLPEVKEELINSFGESIIKENIIDRKKLGEIVFDSRNEMKKLSDITWKYMQIEIDKFLNDNKNKIIILDWLLLSITKYFDMCDIKILLDIPYDIRKQRSMKRDNITKEAFDLREKASINFNQEDFDYVLKSNEENFVKKLVKLL
jgi:dephospho-CoA kinase